MPIVRLLPSTIDSWGLYPKMELRAREFVQKHDLNCPIEPVLQEMRQRWITSPELSGYFLEVDYAAIRGHLISWIGSSYGINKLYIYQAEMYGGPSPLKEIWPAIQEWIMQVNSKTAEPFRVTKACWSTWIEPGVWKRYMAKAGIIVKKIRSELECDIEEAERKS